MSDARRGNAYDLRHTDRDFDLWGWKGDHRGIFGEPYMLAPENRILYFGDLDYEGIRIYEKFAEKFAAAYGAQYDIRLFQCAYERMLTKADRIGIEDLPRTKEGQNRNIGSLFLGWFSQPQQTRIKAILEQDRYIPQEILNIQDMV